MTDKAQKHGVVIFDLDGCVFDDAWRLHLIERDADLVEKYSSYHDALMNDAVLEHGEKYLMNAFQNGMFIAFVTARPISYMAATVAKITETFGIEVERDFKVFMRPEGDISPSPELKSAIASGLLMWAKTMNTRIMAAFDDRQDVVDAYRALDILSFVLDKDGSDAPMLTKADPALEELLKYAAPVLPVPQEAPADIVDGPIQRQSWEDIGRAVADDVATAARTEAAGPAQGDGNMPAPGEGFSHAEPVWNVAEILDDAAMTFADRAEVYGRNDVMYGKVMEILFPNGLVAVTPNEHRKAMFFMHVIGKITRYAASGFQDRDSVHDAITYMAMVESCFDESITR